jgi:hypothetical protein
MTVYNYVFVSVLTTDLARWTGRVYCARGHGFDARINIYVHEHILAVFYVIHTYTYIQTTHALSPKG